MECGMEKKVLAELIGTFLLVFFGTGAAVVTLILSKDINPNEVGIGILGGLGDWLAIAFVFGLTVMACIYLFGKISGSHINPAVTIGLLITKNISLRESSYYFAGQFVGAILGSLALLAVLGNSALAIGGLGATAPGMGISYFQAMFAEFIGTFFLMLVIMGVAVDKKAHPGFAGISIGFTITAIITVLGPFTGASINPARTFAPYLIDFLAGGPNLWIYYPIYLIGPILGAIVAALLYAYIARDNDVCELPQPFQE